MINFYKQAIYLCIQHSSKGVIERFYYFCFGDCSFGRSISGAGDGQDFDLNGDYYVLYGHSNGFVSSNLLVSHRIASPPSNPIISVEQFNPVTAGTPPPSTMAPGSIPDSVTMPVCQCVHVCMASLILFADLLSWLSSSYGVAINKKQPSEAEEHVTTWGAEIKWATWDKFFEFHVAMSTQIKPLAKNSPEGYT